MGLDDRDYMRRPRTESGFATSPARREKGGSGLGHRLVLSFLVLALLAGGGFLLYRDSLERNNPRVTPVTPAAAEPATAADVGR